VKERRWKLVALLATGIMIGVVMVGTPAGAHVSSWAHNWKKHIRPKADARYLPGKNLPSGKPMRGVFMIGETSAGGLTFGENSFSFPRPLASAPVPHYVAEGAVPPAACPGSNDNPQARPGHLCVYENDSGNLGSFTILNPTTNTAGASRWGFMVQTTNSGAGLFYSNGTWAVTALAGSSPAPRTAPERPSSRIEGAARL
jgi:hypothetical protein